jgi:hypothetical protein
MFTLVLRLDGYNVICLDYCSLERKLQTWIISENNKKSDMLRRYLFSNLLICTKDYSASPNILNMLFDFKIGTFVMAFSLAYRWLDQNVISYILIFVRGFELASYAYCACLFTTHGIHND